ncbi:cysteine synthase family protein [Clostridium sardiniense]|uniref:Cysteine synthase family protein n=1 Tax=Clostridium sardiniense TaxID=29369 RepID=A0ABS7L3I4_CLOSR|nr:cysteine synthase family protein [Clostridium sardiniense]MBY0757432.1 cysteine synthase family protein [Clostridium sardiniense]MDQ0462136.1 cysteine synthase A [Clostridium sardiniense]
MNYYNDIRELIGNTPLLKLNNLGIKNGVNVFVKIEGFNPGGSCKDRVGVYMIEKAEMEGILKPGSTIIEATAGNTGIGVALAALNKGYKVMFVVPEKFSIEKQKLMKSLGAIIINTPKEDGMEGAINIANSLLKEIPNSISLNQFNNESNPHAHYETTGKEIYEDLDGEIDYLVAGAGSGGTFSGALRYLKESIDEIKGILADPIGSIIGGGKEGCYKIEGIGNNFIPQTMDMKLVDEIIKVDDEEAFNAARLLAKKEGIIVGSSSGAALSAALKFIEKIDSGNVVVILPDRGDRYFSTDLL